MHTECTREKSGRPGRFGDVMMTFLPPFAQNVAEMVAVISSLHHQIDQAFPIFLACALKNMGRPGYEATTYLLKIEIEGATEVPILENKVCTCLQ